MLISTILLVLLVGNSLAAPEFSKRSALQKDSDEKSEYCHTWRCLNRIKDSNKLDNQCRNSGKKKDVFCYCCGGLKTFFIYGKVCLRYCLKGLDPVTKKVSKEPCRPKTDEEILSKKEFGIFPDVPYLLPEEDIVCSSTKTL